MITGTLGRDEFHPDLGSVAGFMIVMAKPSESAGFAHHDHGRMREGVDARRSG